MMKTTISLLVGASLVMLAPQVVHARGCGGARGGGGYSGGASRGGHSGGESRGGYSGGGQRGRESFGGESRGGYSGGESRGGYSGGGQRGGEYSSSASRGGYSSGAQRGEESSRAGGAAAGYAAGNRTTPPMPGAGGAEAGHAAAGWAGASGTHTALPTDAGYGAAGARTGSAAYAGYHQTEAVSGSAYAARGAAVRTSYSGAGMFGQGWYTAHPAAWNPAGWTAGRAWGAATWPAVGSWCGWGAATQPVYYDYGNNITYQGNQVYYGDQPVGSADQYYQQASTLAQSQPAPDPSSGEWMPLGVFGLVRGSESDPHYVMQLAVNKSGSVAGNYQDVISGTTLPVQGAVDKQTQRLAWTVGDNKNTVGETGIYNLTKDEAPALIHVGKDKTQQWTLVRLKQPQQAAAQQ